MAAMAIDQATFTRLAVVVSLYIYIYIYIYIALYRVLLLMLDNRRRCKSRFADRSQTPLLQLGNVHWDMK